MPDCFRGIMGDRPCLPPGTLPEQGGAFQERDCLVHEDERPLVLVVCEDPSRLEKVREVLRHAGVLPTAGRSVAGAVHLLTQVRVDGCVLCDTVEPGEAADLRDALEEHRLHCPRLFVRNYQPGELPGWTGCDEEDLAAAAVGALQASRGMSRR
jgi:hypothetical protein